MNSSELFVPVPWGHISGRTYGNPNGHKVLAVHGWTDNCGTFDLLSPLLSPSLYLVCIELPGHGHSSHFSTGIPYNHIDYVVAIRRVIRYLKWTKFDYVGHSLGAAIGSMYSAIFSEEVERLVMIDYVKMITWSNEDTKSLYGTFIKEFLALERQKNASFPLITYPLEKLQELYVQVLSGQLTESEAGILLKRGAKKLNPNEEKWTFTRDVTVRNHGHFRLSHDTAFSILSNIRCKLLLIKAIDSNWAEVSEICNNTINIYKANCKSFEYVEVPGNHFVPLTNPSGIAPHINKFLLSERN